MNFLSFLYTPSIPHSIAYLSFPRAQNLFFFIIILRNVYGSLLDTINMIFSLDSSAEDFSR